MHISHGHSQNWNSMICKLAKWISSKQVIGVCHQSLTASNRIPSRKSIKKPPLYSYIFQLILSSREVGARGLLLDFRIVVWKPKPWLYFLVWLNSWWSLLVSYMRKALEGGYLFMDWTCSIGKCKTAVSEVVIFAEHLFLTLISKIWQFRSEVLKIQGFFFSCFPTLWRKKERCWMVRVAAIKRTGGSTGTWCNSWHRQRSPLPGQPRLLGQDPSRKLVGGLSDASVTLPLFS